MPLLHLSMAARNAVLDAITGSIDASRKPGTITLYRGAPPASADDAPSGKRLALLQFGRPAFGKARLGAADARPIGAATAGDSGKAGWARIADGDGTAVFDCDVGIGGAVINLNTTEIAAGGPVIIDSFQLRMPGG